MKIMETAEKYTYSKYAALGDANEGVRYELIEGVIYIMSPGDSQDHQEISGELFWQIRNFLIDKPCKVFHAPFDVCVNAGGDDDVTTVQPDILVVCDKAKLDGKRCNGAPDLIIEIISPSNRKYDMQIKFNAYLKAGVREYWIIDPDDKNAHVYILKNGEYTAKVYDENGAIPVFILEGCKIDLKNVFSNIG